MNNKITRREFVKATAATGVVAGISGSNFLKAQSEKTSGEKKEEKTKTNIEDALKIPKTNFSLPGLYPGRVAIAESEKATADGKFDYEIIAQMVDQVLLLLTDQPDRQIAWSKFFSPKDRIGIKVNPVAGKLLSTSHEIVNAIIAQLLNIGVPISNITIWDRREFQLHEAGFTNENFPGVNIIGTERKDDKDSFYDKEGKLYSEKMIDKDWYYWADIEGEYDKETMPYMVNGGKYSYFTKICTQDLDKIINVPILKNAGASVTLCLKNIAYGSITNTARLHKPLWAETCAEVPCFPPIRDKMVLNIVDGIKGCYDGGPGAKPEFFHYFNTILAGTDPVAVDRIGFKIILKKRIEESLQKEASLKGLRFMEIAEKLGIGIADMDKIQYVKIII